MYVRIFGRNGRGGYDHNDQRRRLRNTADVPALLCPRFARALSVALCGVMFGCSAAVRPSFAPRLPYAFAVVFPLLFPLFYLLSIYALSACVPFA